MPKRRSRVSNGHCDELIAARRARPGEDLVTALVQAENQGDRLDHDELRAMIIALLLAGHDTTRSQIALGMLTFVRHPDQWQLLRQNPGLAGSAVEEVMRCAPMAPTIWRVALEDLTVHELTVPAGSLVLLCLALANTDPRVYGVDQRFDIAKTRPPILAFGAGPHYCVGAHLARLEMRAAFDALSARIAGMLVCGPVPMRPYIGIYGPQSLPVEVISR